MSEETSNTEFLRLLVDTFRGTARTLLSMGTDTGGLLAMGVVSVADSLEQGTQDMELKLEALEKLVESLMVAAAKELFAPIKCRTLITQCDVTRAAIEIVVVDLTRQSLT